MTAQVMLLPGIDAANPLGFLAALGSLRTLARTEPAVNPRLSWRVDAGAWRPVLTTVGQLSESELIERLDTALKAMVNHPAWALGDNLNVDPETYRRYALDAASAADQGDGVHAEFAAAFACETAMKPNSATQVAATQLCLIGGGRQRFLNMVSDLVARTNEEHLERALLRPWDYADPEEGMAMRWDPRDDVRRALRWREPSGDPDRKKRGSMWGANRLAIEALPLLPVIPRGRRLETTSFVTTGSRATWFTWPIWTCPIPLPVIRSLLADFRLRDVSKYRNELARAGVAAAFRSQRLTVDKYRNFTMGVPV